jgi:hypothetical protein
MRDVLVFRNLKDPSLRMLFKQETIPALSRTGQQRNTRKLQLLDVRRTCFGFAAQPFAKCNKFCVL